MPKTCPLEEITTFLSAAKEGNTEQLTAFIFQHPKDSLGSNNRNYELALQNAVCAGQLAAVKLLLEYKADANFAEGQYSLLMLASQKGYMDIVIELCAHGANIHAKERFDEGRNALMFAAESGHRNIVLFLKNQGVNIDYQNRQGNTALLLALMRAPGSSCAENIIEMGANIHVENKDGANALVYAARNGYSKIVNFLILGQVNLNPRAGGDVYSALYEAAFYGHKTIVEALIAAKAEVNIRANWNLTTPLMAAAGTKRLDIVKILVAAGAKIERTNGIGRTVIDYETTQEIKNFLLNALSLQKAEKYLIKIVQQYKHLASEKLPPSQVSQQLKEILSQETKYLALLANAHQEPPEQYNELQLQKNDYLARVKTALIEINDFINIHFKKRNSFFSRGNSSTPLSPRIMKLFNNISTCGSGELLDIKDKVIQDINDKITLILSPSKDNNAADEKTKSFYEDTLLRFEQITFIKTVLASAAVFEAPSPVPLSPAPIGNEPLSYPMQYHSFFAACITGNIHNERVGYQPLQQLPPPPYAPLFVELSPSAQDIPGALSTLNLGVLCTAMEQPTDLRLF